jgi:thioredoxin-like negative regulator of GroEL
MDRTRRRIVPPRPWLLPVLTLGLSVSPVRGVDLERSLAAARSGGGPEQPAVLVFSAAWCGWCRKFQATTLQDPQVDALQDRFHWVKVDADEEPELTARYQVRGLPHTVVIDAQERVLASQPGYMNTEAFVRFLTAVLENPRPVEVVEDDLVRELAALKSLEAPEARAALLRRVVERLAQPPSAERSHLQQALLAVGIEAQGELLELMGDERLAVRAAAWGVLQRLHRSELAFDPFAAAAVRSAQREACRQKLRSAAP